MIKPNFKTLSLSLMAFAAVAVSASEQSPMFHVRALSADSMRSAHASPSEIERGWVRQQQKLDALIAARSAEGLAVPGAIIIPPFQSFPSYRTDVPTSLEAKKAQKASNRGADAPGAAISHD